MTIAHKHDFQLLDSVDAAAYLKIDPKTLQRFARNGKIPAIKVGKLWRFRKGDLDGWQGFDVTLAHHPCRE